MAERRECPQAIKNDRFPNTKHLNGIHSCRNIFKKSSNIKARRSFWCKITDSVEVNNFKFFTGCFCGLMMKFIYRREKRDIPFIISASIREVERRGMNEVGIYRVSGSSSDLQKLKKSFESSKSIKCLKNHQKFQLFPVSLDAYEAEQLLKEVDIHSVTGILKSYLRELPEALFTDLHYQKVCIDKYQGVNHLFTYEMFIYSFLTHLINLRIQMRRRE